MLKNFLLQTYIYLYYIYQFLWNTFFSYVGKVMIIYYSDDDHLSNITLNYYFGYRLHQYRQGVYYIKFFDKNGVNHIGFRGSVADIDWFRYVRPIVLGDVKRRNVLLLMNDDVSQVNLDVLDNYKSNMAYFAERSICMLADIFFFLKIKCSHIKMFTMSPFRVKVEPVGNLSIDAIYN
jgi:hypothetical protein